MTLHVLGVTIQNLMHLLEHCIATQKSQQSELHAAVQEKEEYKSKGKSYVISRDIISPD